MSSSIESNSNSVFSSNGTPLWIGYGLLLIFYTVGIFGILLPIHDQFILLTPLNLIVSLAIMLWFHPDWSWKTVVFLVACGIWGFLAEVFGVNTGLLFGTYEYGPVLGPQIEGTPPVIGINWMLLVYASGMTINQFAGQLHWLVKGILGAALMVFLDTFIEPVAIRLDFWTWEGNIIPIKNYIGWFIVALPIQWLFFYWHQATRNKIAVLLLVLQFAFFIILRLFI